MKHNILASVLAATATLPDTDRRHFTLPDRTSKKGIRHRSEFTKKQFNRVTARRKNKLARQARRASR